MRVYVGRGRISFRSTAPKILMIFACGAGIINAEDPFEMRRLRHELEQCLPPLQMTQEMLEFATAPSPPPAVPIPFPRGLFSPDMNPGSPFRFPRSLVDRDVAAPGKKPFCMKRRQKKVDEKFNNVVLGVAGRRVTLAGRRLGEDQQGAAVSPEVTGIAPVTPAPVPAPAPTPAPILPPAPAPPVAPPTPGTQKRKERQECCQTFQGGRHEKKRRLEKHAPENYTPFLVTLDRARASAEAGRVVSGAGALAGAGVTSRTGPLPHPSQADQAQAQAEAPQGTEAGGAAAATGGATAGAQQET